MFENQFPLINTDKQFSGTIQTTATLNPDNNTYYVDYSGNLHNDNQGNLTLDEYQHQVNPHVKVISWDEYDVLVQTYTDSLVTAPKPITQDDYNYYLEVLPPCRWHTVAGYSVFHMSERNYGNITQWCACSNGKYYAFDDYDNISDTKLAEKLRGI